MERRRFLQRERARQDKQQTTLAPEGVKANPYVYAVKTEILPPPEKQVTCPLCLGLEQFNRFLVSNKKGISRSVGKCPLCGQGMFLKTLVHMEKCTAKQYAEWVYQYSRSGFWKKVDFAVWKRRLQLMGWTQDFWDRYKELKGEDQSESSEDNEKWEAQREAAQERVKDGTG